MSAPERRHDGVWDLRDLASLLWAWRRFLLINFAVVTLGSVLLALLLPSWFRASTSILPPQEDDATFSVTTMLRGLSVPGVRIPTQASPAEVFVAILNSRTLRTEIVRQFELGKVYKLKQTEKAVKEFGRHCGAEVSEEGLIVFFVDDRNPERAAAIANRMVELLDRFNRETRSTRGRRAKKFIEERLVETGVMLATAEDSLRRYQQRTKSLVMPAGETGAADLAARLLAERIDLQTRLQLAASYSSPSSPEMQRLRLRQQALDSQIDRLPGVGIGVARLYRDVRVQEQVFALLTAQLEEAKIQEARDVATVEVLDRAVVPEQRVRPRRAVIVMLGAAASLLFGVGFVLVHHYARRIARDA